MIIPGSLVPERGITIRSPAHRRKARPLDSREDCWDLGRELIVERIARTVRGDEDIIARPRELKIIHEGGCDCIRQFNGEALAGLIPIRAQGWEGRIAPKVAGCAFPIPGLIDKADHHVRLAIDNHITANEVLTGSNRFPYRGGPVFRPRTIGKRVNLHEGKTGGTAHACRDCVIREAGAEVPEVRWPVFHWSVRVVASSLKKWIIGTRGCPRSAEIPESLLRGRNFGVQHSAATLTAPLLRIEEEDPILLDRSIEIEAEVVISQLLFGLVLRI